MQLNLVCGFKWKRMLEKIRPEKQKQILFLFSSPKHSQTFLCVKSCWGEGTIWWQRIKNCFYFISNLSHIFFSLKRCLSFAISVFRKSYIFFCRRVELWKKEKIGKQKGTTIYMKKIKNRFEKLHQFLFWKANTGQWKQNRVQLIFF